MSIEKMVMVNMVGSIEDLDKVTKSVVLSKAFQPVNALQEINTTDFTLSTTEDNMDALIDVNYVKPYMNNRDYTEINKKIKKIKEMSFFTNYGSIKSEELILNYEEMESKLDDVSSKFETVYNELIGKRQEKTELEEFIDNMEYLKNIDIPMENINNMSNFYFDSYKISKENVLKLKSNYQNIPAIVSTIRKDKEHNIVIAITPKVLKNETDRIFRSLNCELIKLSNKNSGTPLEIINELKKELIYVNSKIKELEKNLRELSLNNNKLIYIIDKSYQLETKSAEIKDTVAYTNEFFYLCGWVPESMIDEFEDEMDVFGNSVLILKKQPEEIENKNIVPPTKLRNNVVVKPFETMVNMYGIPSYNEMDPTTFLGISYMIMFGAMFGDLGQGLIFVFFGLYLRYKKRNINIGGILTRLGISSSVFGIVYGSIFGFEDVIPALIIRPMEDIADTLLYAIVFGCAMLIIGFIYSMINSIKRKDLENGLFGKDGLMGLIFYISLLTFAITKARKVETISIGAWIVLFIVMLVVMLFKQPLANLVKNKRPLYNEDKGDYFIEGGFGVIETLLSMFSNTISFIRVGAFALNHVGLFIAFTALAQMMQNSFESILMYILGNIVIIGLEGLIVFIQGLRLEYYELFSKYYEGSGIPFQPVTIVDEDRLKAEKRAMNMMNKTMITEK